MHRTWAQSLNPYKHLLARRAEQHTQGARTGAVSLAHPPPRKRSRLTTPYQAQAGELFETHKARGLRLYCPACKQEHTFAADARLQCPTCGKTHLEGLSPTQLERHQDLPPARPKLSAR